MLLIKYSFRFLYLKAIVVTTSQTILLFGLAYDLAMSLLDLILLCLAANCLLLILYILFN